MQDKWVVDVKGGPNRKTFEISVLLDSNEHGKRSYGWFGGNKLLVSHSGGPCHTPLIQTVWDKMVTLAGEVAEELNSALCHKNEIDIH